MFIFAHNTNFYSIESYVQYGPRGQRNFRAMARTCSVANLHELKRNSRGLARISALEREISSRISTLEREISSRIFALAGEISSRIINEQSHANEHAEI